MTRTPHALLNGLALAAILAFTACGGDDSSSTSGGGETEISSETLDDLPNCTEGREGDSAYISSLRAYYVCEDGRWAFASAALDSVETVDDLAACTENRNGDTAYVKDTNAVFLCLSEKWRLLGSVVENEDSLKNCSESREGLRVYLTSESVSLICSGGKWYSFDIADLLDEEDGSSSSAEKSSSSKWEAYEKSSSSASVVSSSSAVPSSTAVSSNSAVSSSSVESSSSAAESSSSLVITEVNGAVTDSRDGQTYAIVTIGSQKWMAENLNYEASEGSYCYNDSAVYCEKYGRLYTWDAASSSCPEGYHLPDSVDLYTLNRYVKPLSSEGVGTALKSTSGWESDGSGTDLFGFSALPAGRRTSGGEYLLAGSYAYYWTDAENSTSDAAYQYLSSDGTGFESASGGKGVSYSVRCVNDTTWDTGDSAIVIEYGTLMDSRDGQSYKTVEIGTQTWMAENLNYAYNKATTTEDSSSFCYNDEPDSCAKYGRLYIWSAAMDSAAVFGSNGQGCGYGTTCTPTYPVRGVCPEGWHLPDSTEWEDLYNYVDANNGSEGVGTSLKSPTGWRSYSGVDTGTDLFGFSALPAGGRFPKGSFNNAGFLAEFWSATEYDSNNARYRDLIYTHGDLTLSYYTKNFARSVRCLKD